MPRGGQSCALHRQNPARAGVDPVCPPPPSLVWVWRFSFFFLHRRVQLCPIREGNPWDPVVWVNPRVPAPLRVAMRSPLPSFPCVPDRLLTRVQDPARAGGDPVLLPPLVWCVCFIFNCTNTGTHGSRLSDSCEGEKSFTTKQLLEFYMKREFADRTAHRLDTGTQRGTQPATDRGKNYFNTSR